MNKKSAGRYFSKLLLVLSALLFSVVATAQTRFSRVVVFGDSLSDPGNAFVLTGDVSVRPYQFIPDAPYARGGHHFSNGQTWVEQFAQDLQLTDSVGPAFQVRGKFSNYAVGGARARPGTPFDLSAQAVTFLGDFGGLASADALYVVYVGGNDLRDALAALATDPSGATSMAIISDTLNVIANNIVMLASAGAREFMVPNVPNFALVPAVRFQGPQAQGAAQALSVAFNQALATVLTGLENSLPVTIHRLDVFALVSQAVAAPAAFGFTDVETPCVTPGLVAHGECARPDDFLFWDGVHPTRAGHAMVARKAREIFTLP